MNPVFIDLETRSACDLRKEGGARYASDPSTRLLTAAWLVDGESHVWLPGVDGPAPIFDLHLQNSTVHYGPAVPSALPTDRPWVGHNAWTFDRGVWAALYPDHVPPRWIDTYPLALSVGLPGGINQIGKMLSGEGKYEDGSKLLKKWSRSGRDDSDACNVPVGAVALIARYNVQDVAIMARLYDVITADWRPTEHERKVLECHDRVNTRGVPVDLKMTGALIDLLDATRAETVKRISDLTGGVLGDMKALNSRAKVLAWVNDAGVSFGSSLKKSIVERFIEEHTQDPDDISEESAAEADEDTADSKAVKLVCDVLSLRSSVLRVTQGKLTAAMRRTSDDGRLRYWAVYHGAGTGRFAARGLQPHNMPRPKDGIDTWQFVDEYERTGALPLERVRAMIPEKYKHLTPDDVASGLLRSVITGKLTAADLSNIEARVLAWWAGEEWLMKSFWDRGDPYMAMAASLFGQVESWPVYHDDKGKPLPPKKHPYRQVGKVVVLGCGYQMGVDAFKLYAASNGIDLDAVGITAADAIHGFRRKHPAVAGEEKEYDGHVYFRGGLWDRCEQAVLAAVKGGRRTSVGPVSWTTWRGHLIMTLPSGRRIVYRDVKVEPRTDKHGRTKDTVTYRHPRYGRQGLYGGKIVENAVQAMSRDVIVHGLVLCEESGIWIVLHVHDELVGETDRTHDFMVCVTTPPDWLTDFPLDAEGSTSSRYAKAASPAWKKEHGDEWLYRNGRRI